MSFRIAQVIAAGQREIEQTRGLAGHPAGSASSRSSDSTISAASLCNA